MQLNLYSLVSKVIDFIIISLNPMGEEWDNKIPGLFQLGNIFPKSIFGTRSILTQSSLLLTKDIDPPIISDIEMGIRLK